MAERLERTGIIIRCIGGLYGVRLLPLSAEDALCLCRARGVFRHEKIAPLPGDTVRISPTGVPPSADPSRDAAYTIDEILPRTHALVRPPLANLSHLAVVIPAARPAPDLTTADKLLIAAEARGIAPLVVITKRDLDPDGAARLLDVYRQAGFPAFTAAADAPDLLDTLRAYIFSLDAGEKPVVAAFAGVSGAGKSTLLSRLFPTLSLKTGEVSRRAERGRQTTRHVELYMVSDGARACLIADTPGFSLLDLTRDTALDPGQLAACFREFSPYLGKCRYTKCTHTREEGCAILEAARTGALPASRCASYAAIFDECRKIPEWKRKQEAAHGEGNIPRSAR